LAMRAPRQIAGKLKKVFVMDTPAPLPNIPQLKNEATQLRDRQVKIGNPISLSKSLELLAHNYGYADWNTLCARAKTQVRIYVVDQRVSGTYLGQKFTGSIKKLQSGPPGQLQMATILFDQPVNVIKFEGMQNLRRRVRVLIDAFGKCPDKSGNGRPIIVFD